MLRLQNGPESLFNQSVDYSEIGEILNHMVEYRLDATFHALADPTRRGMLAKLSLGEKSIGDLAEPFSMTFAGAAKHVKVLEGAGWSRAARSAAAICAP
jgi:DNA-binding transcriptional ArsR family regulator